MNAAAVGIEMIDMTTSQEEDPEIQEAKPKVNQGHVEGHDQDLPGMTITGITGVENTPGSTIITTTTRVCVLNVMQTAADKDGLTRFTPTL